MPAPHSDLYLDARGVRLRYRDEGRGPAVIFLHGWTLDLDQWDPQAAALAKEFRVVRLDRRGFGVSSGRPSTGEDAADIFALCRHLDIDCVALVGMSQGARAALQFAHAHPRMTSCFILDGPPRFGAEDVAGSSHDIPYQHYLARMIARYPGRDLTGGVAQADPVSLPQGFESVNRPALILNGEFDLDSRKRFAAQLAVRLPRAECTEIPASGHLCNLDNPGKYNEAVERFLKRHTSPVSLREV